MSRKHVLYFMFFASNAFAQEWKEVDLRVYEKYDQLEYIFNNSNDTTYLINFWATWCKPCVAELPYIDGVAEDLKAEKYKSILVSLDFEHQISSRLIPFLNKNNISSEVMVLLDGKTSKWIPKVDSEWSGAIPITIIYNKENRSFYEKQFHSKDEVLGLVKSFLTQ